MTKEHESAGSLFDKVLVRDAIAHNRSFFLTFQAAGLWDHDRNISNDQIHAWAQSGGVVGIAGVGRRITSAGYAEIAIRGVLGENWRRVAGRVWR